MQNSSPFGGVSLLVVGDFLQLPPVNQKGVFMKPIKGSYKSFNGWLLEPDKCAGWDCSAEQWSRLLNRVREGQQTDNDVIQIKALANTDTATWPDEFVKVYLNNYLAGQENEDCIGKLDSEVVVIKTQDSSKVIETNTCFISIPDKINLSNWNHVLVRG